MRDLRDVLAVLGCIVVGLIGGLFGGLMLKREQLDDSRSELRECRTAVDEINGELDRCWSVVDSCDTRRNAARLPLGNETRWRAQ